MQAQSHHLPEVKGDCPAIELEVVRDDGPHPGGRPLFLTPKRFLRICRWIERGESASEACRRELVTYQGFRRDVSRNPKYQRRLRQAEEVREHFLREFHVANITRHAAKNVAASMFWLERRYPQEFALKTVNRDSGDMEKQALCNKISRSSWSKTRSLRSRSPHIRQQDCENAIPAILRPSLVLSPSRSPKRARKGNSNAGEGQIRTGMFAACGFRPPIR